MNKYALIFRAETLMGLPQGF